MQGEQSPMRAKVWTVSAALLLGLDPGAPGQGLVAPASLWDVEGSTGTGIPFGLDREVRLQCIYDADELAFSGPRMIQKLVMRADFSSDPGREEYPVKQFLVLHLAMSTTEVQAWNASTTFADNYGTDFTPVIQDARISLPAQPPLATGPRPFNIELPFDQPWFYAATPVRGSGPAPGGLLFDMRITVQPRGSYRLDVPGGCSGDPMYFGNLGAACVTSPNGRPLSIEAPASMMSGGSLTYTVRELPPGAPFALALALTDQGDWFGNPLPYDLSGYLQGAPGCWINVPWQAVLLGQADPAGVGTLSFAIPLGRNHVGSSLFAQAICRDLAANQLLHVTSQGLRSTICGPLGISRIYNVGDAWAETGQRSIGVAPVIELR